VLHSGRLPHAVSGTWLCDFGSCFCAMLCRTCALHSSQVPDDEVIHVEDGSWSGANNGDPQVGTQLLFASPAICTCTHAHRASIRCLRSQWLKWNPNFFSSTYDPERNSWAVLVAASNRILTAQSIQPYQSLTNVLRAPSGASYTEMALHYFLCGQASDYEYWPTDPVWTVCEGYIWGVPLLTSCVTSCAHQ